MMNILSKLKDLVLPKTIDFYGELTEQSKITESIIENLFLNYTAEEQNDILVLVEEAKKSRKEKLIELEKVFITPVDREAISRTYSHLYWIALSVEHLVKEMQIYGVSDLNEFKKILELLKDQIVELTEAFSLFKAKKFDEIIGIIAKIIHMDNLLVQEYSTQLDRIFKGDDMNQILKKREILSQLKEISKRIHFCANQIEDIVFKVD